jgi:hypothetical protein
MQVSSAQRREWVERPEGCLGRTELKELVCRLTRIPHGTENVRIEWDRVTHLDFRGLAGLAAQVRRISESGIGVEFTGFSPYLIAILRVALPVDSVAMFESFRVESRMGGRFSSPPVPARLDEVLAPFQYSEN